MSPILNCFYVTVLILFFRCVTVKTSDWKVAVWQMKELQRSLTTSCPLKFFKLVNKRAGNTEKSTNQQQFPFSAQNCPKWKEASNCYRERREGLTLKGCLFISCICLNDFQSDQLRYFFIHQVCNAQVKICRIDRYHFPNFNKLQLLRLVTNSVTNRSWSLVYIQHYF